MSMSRNSTKKKNSKASKSGASIIKRIALTSKKSRYVAVIVALAVIGSLLTFISFASNGGQTWTYTRAGDNMRNFAIAPCQASDYIDAAKNNITVSSLACPGNSGSGLAQAKSFNAYLPAGYSGYYRACATAKGSGYFSVYLSVSVGRYVASYPQSNIAARAKLNSQTYAEYCTNFTAMTAPTQIESNLTVANSPGQASWINVSQVKIEKRANQIAL